MFRYPCRLIFLNFVILQEEEILDLLEQCEADETITFDRSGNRPMSKGPKVTKLFYTSDLGMKKKTTETELEKAGIRPGCSKACQHQPTIKR